MLLKQLNDIPQLLQQIHIYNMRKYKNSQGQYVTYMKDVFENVKEISVMEICSTPRGPFYFQNYPTNIWGVADLPVI